MDIKEIMKNKELKNDLVVSWNEAKQLRMHLTELSDKELVERREFLIERAENILHWLGKYVNEDDVLHEIL